MVTLSQQLKLLADGFRKRYGKTETLTLADMTKLVTPPAFPSGTDLLGGKPVHLGISKLDGEDPSDTDVPFQIVAVPPKMSVPITLSITVSSVSYLSSTDSKLIFHSDEKGDIPITLPNMQPNYVEGKTLIKTITAKIPANTFIDSDIVKWRIKALNECSVGNLEKIVATYVGG
ncbi:hypothetical protein [Limosilactobacillus difficilis]|uniref:hypothetical protein n=1 Tax=Limosilactobacillus difficilis TaxID=2991838 RepID=UPI0024BAA347|nr:hypothetical protein [Limosilactobacillus difficilis]